MKKIILAITTFLIAVSVFADDLVTGKPFNIRGTNGDVVEVIKLQEAPLAVEYSRFECYYHDEHDGPCVWGKRRGFVGGYDNPFNVNFFESFYVEIREYKQGGVFAIQRRENLYGKVKDEIVKEVGLEGEVFVDYNFTCVYGARGKDGVNHIEELSSRKAKKILEKLIEINEETDLEKVYMENCWEEELRHRG